MVPGPGPAQFRCEHDTRNRGTPARDRDIRARNTGSPTCMPDACARFRSAVRKQRGAGESRRPRPIWWTRPEQWCAASFTTKHLASRTRSVRVVRPAPIRVTVIMGKTEAEPPSEQAIRMSQPTRQLFWNRRNSRCGGEFPLTPDEHVCHWRSWGTTCCARDANHWVVVGFGYARVGAAGSADRVTLGLASLWSEGRERRRHPRHRVSRTWRARAEWPRAWLVSASHNPWTDNWIKVFSAPTVTSCRTRAS